MTKTVSHRGCALSYDVRGEGEPVVLVQGVGVHGAGWGPQVAALSGRYRCVTLDNRGMGRSEPRGDAPITIATMAEDVLAVMDAEGIAAAHLVGHSMGGLIALELALAARARVRSLALLCTIARGRDATDPSARMVWLGLRSSVGTRRMRRHAFLEIVAAPGELAGADRDALAARLEPFFGHDLADRPPIAWAQLDALRKHDVTPRLGELAGLRTLVVAAEHDPIARPASGRAIAAGIPGARYEELAGASHGVPLMDPPRIDAMLLAHLGG